MRDRSRSVVVIVGLVASVGLTATALRARPAAIRGPVSRPVAGVTQTERRVGSARLIESRGAPEELLPDTLPPRVGVQLLWLDGRRAAPTRRGAVALDGAGGVVEFDERLRPRQRLLRGEGREWLSVAAGIGTALWLTDATGALLEADSAGNVRAAAPTPLQFPDVASDPRTGTPWLVRSTRRFSYQFDQNASPLVVRADATGRVVRALGSAFRPKHVLLADLANAGQVAVGDSVIFYAPFIRDELVAMTFTGDTLWVASRGLSQSTAEPRFELRGRRAVVDYHPVNIGVTIGPDRLVYLLSTPGPTTLKSRLDVFDGATGGLVRTAQLSTAAPSLAADASGRVYLLDAVHLLAGVAPPQRQPAPDVDLATLGGGTYVLAAQRGRVQLLNLWASWCGPCRQEMPALDSLRREFGVAPFDFVGLNDDTDVEAARKFLSDRGFDFVVGLARGRAREQFHAPGLPVTVLVDRDGREVRRWIGYTGPRQIAEIRALIRAEIERGPAADTDPGAHHHRGM